MLLRRRLIVQAQCDDRQGIRQAHSSRAPYGNVLSI
jgi:hypothetical protein